MTNTLKLFVTSSLFDATSALLEKLNIRFNRQTAEPVSVADLYDGTMPLYLQNALKLINHTYFIGVANDQSLDSGEKSDNSLSQISDTIKQGGRYDGMFIFACDAKVDANITRSDISALTRAFNRISYANPVILIIRQSNNISLSTCERMTYTQEWRKNFGEKLGKVSILRNVDCLNPHRGHINIIEAIGEERFDNFEALYNHWKEQFSNELLTKKFYSELSDWYAWAVQISKFPNNLSTKVDDQKFNDEACIRLITRLIFVWFLKRKHLIPKELFDEKYIRENLIDNFDPHSKNNQHYDTKQSKYYRLILQNLFFAMLNCPIVAEGKSTPNNRRFMSQKTYHGVNPDYNINNIMRYESEFKDGGNIKFLKLANQCVPFLNGGLFDCLDDKNTGIYYDGFSENKKSLDSLFLPDYLFFGEEVGKSIDLSKWYGDAKKKKVSARGIIDILNRYSFTIEENTPLEQEVSLDPELLGKVFENLLAAYNIETHTSARKQTGSFYTPREIVQYMVDESLVAHLKRKCGEEDEALYRSLVSYSADDVAIPDEKRKSIVEALYECSVLDPACGSGAFPMGVLQQMVHILKKVDPSNEMWNKKVVDISIEETYQEMQKAVGTKDKAKIEEESKARLADIEEAFNNAINYPDYARKLFLIENCIHGVDIQPIAIQISKLRFFISLVVDQKPTSDPKSNFGIRPLPNLESKFVCANTLIPLDREKTLFDDAPEIKEYEKELQELSHRIFLSKRNTEKTRLRQDMDSTRIAMAMALNNNGFLGKSGYDQLVNWDMFDQNCSAKFFDPEWMFGVKNGFDIVIGNPPYIRKTSLSNTDKQNYEKLFVSANKQYDIYLLFIEKGLNSLANSGFLCYINPIRFFNSDYGEGCRKYIMQESSIKTILDVSQLSVFENAMTYPCVLLLEDGKKDDNIITYIHPDTLDEVLCLNSEDSIQFPQSTFNTKEYLFIIPGDSKVSSIIAKIDGTCNNISDFFDVARGLPNNKVDFDGTKHYAIKSKSVDRYGIIGQEILIDTEYSDGFTNEMVILPRTVLYLKSTLKRKDLVLLDRIYYLTPNNSSRKVDNSFVIGVINSKLTNFWFEYKYSSTKVSGNYFDLNGNQIRSIPLPVKDYRKTKLLELVDSVLKSKGNIRLENEIDIIVYHLYDLTYDEVLIIDPQTPITREQYDNFNIDKA